MAEEWQQRSATERRDGWSGNEYSTLGTVKGGLKAGKVRGGSL